MSPVTCIELEHRMQRGRASSGDAFLKFGWLQELDGWRAISILLVLSGHLLPLGPARFHLNGAVATAGMGIFFVLSGFLITSFLLREPNAKTFLIRRGARILPLAWGYMAIVMATETGVPNEAIARHFLFIANLPPFGLIDKTAHMWSLCLEVQFYLIAALVVATLGRRGLLAMPAIALTVTVYRIYTETHLSIVTWLRADEILAGCSLALAYAHGWLDHLPNRRNRLLALVGLLYMVACHGGAGWMNYLRPYLAAGLVGLTIGSTGGVQALLKTRSLRYVATISYALYVFHPLLASTWLGSGFGIEKYIKRPLLFLCLWAVAHLSTMYYEAPWMRWSKRLSESARNPSRTITHQN